MNIQADWKGEHLIKAPAVEPEAVDMKNIIDNKQPRRDKVQRTARCTVPDCGKLLSTNNTSTVCKAHIHLKPYCQCSNCPGRMYGQ